MVPKTRESWTVSTNVFFLLASRSGNRANSLPIFLYAAIFLSVHLSEIRSKKINMPRIEGCSQKLSIENDSLKIFADRKGRHVRINNAHRTSKVELNAWATDEVRTALETL